MERRLLPTLNVSHLRRTSRVCTSNDGREKHQNSAGGGVRTHEGLRHRISYPEADLKCGTTFVSVDLPL